MDGDGWTEADRIRQSYNVADARYRAELSFLKGTIRLMRPWLDLIDLDELEVDEVVSLQDLKERVDGNGWQGSGK